MTLPMISFFAMLVGLTALAVWLRVRPASQIAISYLAAAIATYLAPYGRYTGMEAGLFAIDALLLLRLWWTALHTEARWPIIDAALQFITVMGHLAVLTEAPVPALAYAIMLQWTAWPSLVVLATGVWLDRCAGRISSSSSIMAVRSTPHS